MENDFKFVIKGKAMVLIDWANIRNQQKKLGWKIDLEKLYKWLVSNKNIEKIQFFYGYENNKRSHKFLKEVESFGYEMIIKEVKYLETNIQKSHFSKNIENIIEMYFLEAFGETKIRKGLLTEEDFEKFGSFSEKISPHLKAKKPKCDFDVEITTEIMKHFEDFQTIILFSGDGDFAYPIKECLDNNKKVFVLSGFKKGEWSSIGKELWAFREKQTKYPIIINLLNLTHLKISRQP